VQAGTGNVVEAVRHARTLMREIKLVQSLDENELYTYAKQVRLWGVHHVHTSTGALTHTYTSSLFPRSTHRRSCAGYPPRPHPQMCGIGYAAYCSPHALIPLPPLSLLQIGAPFHLLQQTAKVGRLPVVNFAAGGVSTPADAALMMQLGMDGVFVGSGAFLASCFFFSVCPPHTFCSCRMRCPLLRLRMWVCLHLSTVHDAARHGRRL
jgi:pyridoxal biosynthesis lyase PdxS